jgi:glycosyltransferase involved in cell wall biosynthesis
VKTVTIGVPVFKRLSLLPSALRSVAAQDYPDIELLVSDNGENGPELEDLVREHYPRPFRMRRNEVTEPVMSRHFNQIVDSATGDYFVLLCDDDEIGPTFVSALAAPLERDPEIGVALPYVDVMDEEGRSQPRQVEHPPESFSGVEFVRMWARGGYSFWNFVTVMARTADVRAVGGYPAMPTGDDDALVLKLALGRVVAYSRDAVFRNRWYESSHGLAIDPWELAADIRSWLDFLEEDPVLREFAKKDPAAWPEVRGLMRGKAWKTFRHRYKTMYRDRMKGLDWVRAGFALPYIGEYYRWLIPYLLRVGVTLPKRLVRGGRPHSHFVDR